MLKMFRKAHKPNVERDLGDEPVVLMEEVKIENIKVDSEIEVEEEEDDDGFIEQEVKMRLKELRNKSCMSLIHEDLCLKEHEEGRSSSDWRVSEIKDQEPPCHGFDKLYGNYCEWMLFFDRRHYGCRAMMLETVAVVPGIVGRMLLHCKSLRRFEHSEGWIKALLEEAENERMHLMTFMEVAKPRWYERALVITVQGIFFNSYFLAYLASSKLAHRVVGYLKEKAIHSYTEFLKELDKIKIENVLAPAIAIDYWRLQADFTLRDVVMVVRVDEAHHCDVHHLALV
ncbi:hypothetical protein GIB67_029149 [Kingdonia uniflora]|uniref:Ubiquinol oxidase n=1 Tax=Kingdonia uniflora TaxID=39325 RepID=A0A7J7N3H8_9MAGN|nr:hypothetical protein GIB67_029149 [Kingdonia uniflora]